MSRFQGEDFQAVLLGNKLYVFGKTTVPSPAYVAGFYKSNPQGINPTQLILDFGWYARPGTWIQQEVEIPIEYTLEDGAANYTSVLLRDPIDGYTFELRIDDNSMMIKSGKPIGTRDLSKQLTATHMVVVDIENGGCDVQPIGAPPSGYHIRFIGTKDECERLCSP